MHDNLDALEGPFSGESQVLGSFSAPQAPSVGPPVALFNIFEDPTEHVDLSESHPEIVRQLMARLDELYGEMVAGGTTGLMPQWVPYHTCDTPDKSCARQPVPLNLAALRKGCLDVFVPGAPRWAGRSRPVADRRKGVWGPPVSIVPVLRFTKRCEVQPISERGSPCAIRSLRPHRRPARPASRRCRPGAS